jgi:hypothetical protein
MFGIRGVSWAVVFGAAAVLPVWVAMLVRSARLRAADFLMPILSPLIAGFLVCGLMLLLPAPSLTWLGLLSYGTLIVLGYCGVSAILYRLLPHSGVGAVIKGTGK